MIKPDGYEGCRNCTNQIEPLRMCEWAEKGGDGKVHMVCPRWENRKNDWVSSIDNAPTVDAITMEQINKYVIEINKILEEEKDDARWCAGLRYSLICRRVSRMA